MIAWGKPAHRPENRLGVRLLGWTNLAFTRLYHHVKVIGAPRLPPSGPAILICNHTSALDPLLLQSACTRLITWMMAKEYYDLKALNWVYRTIEAIPVERQGRDLAATRAGLRALQNGRVLGIFPEGKIETTRELLPFAPGVALLAIRGGVPVFPAYLDGTQRNKEMKPAVLAPQRAVLAFGPEVQFDRNSISRDALERASEKCREAINNLALSARVRYTLKDW